METEDYDRLEELGRRSEAMKGCTIYLLEEELKNLNSEEQEAPAYGFEMSPQWIWYPHWEPERPSLLLNSDHPLARPLLAPARDADFYCSEASPTAIQSLVITQRAPASETWQDLMAEIREGLNLNALKELLN